MTGSPALYVTNYNRDFTGVSATIAGVAREQARTLDLRLVGNRLPGAPAPITRAEARHLSRTPPPGKAFSIWHVRRNVEMASAVWARDVLRLPIRIVFTSAAQHRHSVVPRWLISRMDAIIATSAGAAQFFSEVAAVIPHGVDTERYRPAEDRRTAWEALGYGGDRGVAIVGRVRPEKGTDVFVDAMIRVMEQDKNTVALVLGATKPTHRAFLNRLKRKVTTNGLAHRIRFLGFVGHAAQPKILRALSLVVNVARYEPFGLVPLEGMASGTPFVATATGYYRELSADGRAGRIVEPGDVEGTAHAVSELLADPDRIEGMGAASRQLAERCYSIAREVGEIGAVYDRLWSSRAPPRAPRR